MLSNKKILYKKFDFILLISPYDENKLVTKETFNTQVDLKWIMKRLMCIRQINTKAKVLIIFDDVIN